MESRLANEIFSVSIGNKLAIIDTSMAVDIKLTLKHICEEDNCVDVIDVNARV